MEPALRQKVPKHIFTIVVGRLRLPTDRLCRSVPPRATAPALALFLRLRSGCKPIRRWIPGRRVMRGGDTIDLRSPGIQPQMLYHTPISQRASAPSDNPFKAENTLEQAVVFTGGMPG